MYWYFSLLVQLMFSQSAVDKFPLNLQAPGGNFVLSGYLPTGSCALKPLPIIMLVYTVAMHCKNYTVKMIPEWLLQFHVSLNW